MGGHFHFHITTTGAPVVISSLFYLMVRGVYDCNHSRSFREKGLPQRLITDRSGMSLDERMGSVEQRCCQRSVGGV